MNWRDFFKPTIGKLIVPLIFFVWMVYYDLFSSMFGRTPVIRRFEIAITHIPHLTLIIVTLVVLYLVSCLVSQFRKNAQNI